jgi:SAM-dependent methyltransferase
MQEEPRPPVIDYEDSDYQTRFWDTGGREYEDLCEAIAIKRLLPRTGRLLLELGAGAGRNTLRYEGIERVVLLDYSRTQLKQAQERLGLSDRFIFVAADIYRLPFINRLFDVASMIRTLHHMADAPAALHQVSNMLQPGANFILEYANKRNLKAILRYAIHRQVWNPFDLDPIEYAPLNFDFHPRAIGGWLKEAGFHTERILAVSHFRIGLIKRTVPAKILAWLDSLLQWTGALWQVTPSVFLRAKTKDGQPAPIPADPIAFFKCPECGKNPLVMKNSRLTCPSCEHTWSVNDGIYDFRSD